MGDIADDMINGVFDCVTGEYIGRAVGYPRRANQGKGIRYKQTPAEKKIASIRKEIAINIKNGMKVQDARRDANLKYGKGWRERGLTSNGENQWTEEDLKPFK